MNSTDLKKFFKYYQENEKQFIETTRYVCVDRKCKGAYSIVYANLLLSICSDFEALIRYCFGKKDDEILEIEPIIELLENDSYFANIFNQKVEFEGYTNINPLKVVYYKGNKYFEWWKAYNKIKHNKLKSIHCANQSNVVLALSSLYILNRYALKKCAIEENGIDIFLDDTSIIKLIDFETECTNFSNVFFRNI